MPYESISSKRCLLLNNLLKLITICYFFRNLGPLDVQDASIVQAKVLSQF